jgi:DNA-binding response OmpR family regulator
MASQTILIVEDDAAIADSVAYHLGRAGYRTLTAADGVTGLRLFTRERPDLVVLDLMLPQLDGWRFTEEVRSQDPDVPVIMCSARTSEHDRVHGLEIGADDYMTKPFSMKELVARVSAHLRRRDAERGRAGSGPIEAAGLVIDPDQVQAFAAGRSVGLTPREFNVLLVLARAAGKPLSRNKIYREAWGYEMMAGDRSVDVFVRKVRRKLHDAIPGTGFVVTHYGVGYRFDPGSTGDGA